MNVSKLGRNGQFSAQLVSINPLTKNKDIWPIDVAEIDTRGIYSLGFTPIEPASYKCILMFNNKQLKGSIFFITSIFLEHLYHTTFFVIIYDKGQLAICPHKQKQIFLFK